MECDICNTKTTASLSDQIGALRICDLCQREFRQLLQERVFSKDGWRGSPPSSLPGLARVKDG